MKVFITGTDTGIGKTYVTCALLEMLNARGLRTIASKPFAAGCDMIDDKAYNDDALKLQKAASVKLDYDLINPVKLLQATAPHIAAELENIHLNGKMLEQHLQSLENHQADYHLIEGAGGWSVPLNDRETLGQAVANNNLPVILVVGIRLGCINHSLLSARAIQQDGAKLIGWIANCIDPDMPYQTETIHTIKQQITAPFLGIIPCKS